MGDLEVTVTPSTPSLDFYSLRSSILPFASIITDLMDYLEKDYLFSVY